MRSASICSRPALSKMIASAVASCAALRRRRRSRDVLRDAVAVEAEFLLLREDLKLVDGGGALDVARDDERAIAAFLEQLAELDGRGGLARAVEADHQDLERPRGGEVGGAFAEETDQFVVDDLDDLLAGGDALEDLLADALLLYALDEVACDLEVDVGGEERGAHLLERLRQFLGKFADAAEVAEGGAEFFVSDSNMGGKGELNH